jgi:hypothetical protein
MTARRKKIWLAVAGLFTLINVGGAAWAGVEGQALHAASHVVGTLLGAFWVWWLLSRPTVEDRASEAIADDRIDQLEQAVDAVALQVERLGEAQRFDAKLRAERVDEKR